MAHVIVAWNVVFAGFSEKKTTDYSRLRDGELHWMYFSTNSHQSIHVSSCVRLGRSTPIVFLW